MLADGGKRKESVASAFSSSLAAKFKAPEEKKVVNSIAKSLDE